MQGCKSYFNMTRRDSMRMGIASFLGVSVRDLVTYAGTAHPAKCEHVIMLWMSGGMSHIDTFDPKPGRETQGEFEAIDTSADGIQLGEIMATTATQMKHGALIRSITGAEGAHDRATYHLRTAQRPIPVFVHPGMGSVVVSEKERLGALPAYVAINGRAPQAGYLGQECDAYFVGTPGQIDPYMRLPYGVNSMRQSRRLALLTRYNKDFTGPRRSADLTGSEKSYEKAVEFMKSPSLQAFDITKERPEVVEAYGDSEFGRGCLLARRLVEQGVRFVQVSQGGFDTHNANFDAMRRLGAIIDPAIGSLVADLQVNGLLDKTMVVVLSEFGRTPRINGGAGRDHYPRVFSSFIAGGGVKPGNVVGASDEDGVAAAERPVRPQDLNASILHAMGIDYKKELMTPIGRPMKYTDDGEAVTELFG